MNDAQLDAERMTDRQVRERIDPLLARLSSLGKIELATRLMGEALLSPLRDRQTIPQTQLAAPAVRVLLPAAKEEGEREEAPRSGSPEDHGSADGAAEPTSHGGS
jgi:hypothetical protein